MIPLQSDSGTGYWGESNRKADHAAVAMNSVGDVLVAFHSSRPSFNSLYPTLKQVEIVLVVYNSAIDSWSLSLQNQKAVGGVNPSPLSQFYPQTDVKCERPDVIAVGEWFFVVWTRIYERNYGSSQINEPAVLECAWVKRDSNGVMQVYTNGSIAGQGAILDADAGGPAGSRFFVRECAGCPDAVVLHPGDPNASPPIPPTVGVVYPHQTDFGDYTGDATRRFELRFQSCSIDPTTLTITAVKYPPLVASNPPPAGIRYDGPADAAGIILPDAAPGSVPWRFGLAYEEQTTQPVMTGRIQLQTWDVDPTGPGLALVASQSFGNQNDPAFRRRPVIASYPPAFPGEDVFAIAFNKTITGADADVLYEEWNLTNGIHKLLWTVGWGWDQNGDDRKPAPLIGRELAYQKYYGRCYAERDVGGGACQLLKYVRLDATSEDVTSVLDSADQLQRPAAVYHYGGVHDDVALTWERMTDWNGTGNPLALRIWLRME